jgi:ribose transport system substrate-binding protein
MKIKTLLMVTVLSLVVIAAVLVVSACTVPTPAAPTKAPAAPTAVPEAVSAEPTAVPMFDCSVFKKDPPWTIANSSQGRTNSWQIMHDAYFELAAETTYKGLIKELLYADANGNADKQISDIEDLITKKPDLLIVNAMGAGALVGVVEKAWDAGIPVVFGDSKANTDKYVTYVERTNCDHGRKMAEWLANKLNGQGGIIMLSGIAGVSAAEDRLRCAREVFAKYPGIKELGQAYCDWSPVKGKQSTQAFMAANPKIDGVWSDSALMSMGAIQAFMDAGKPVPPMTTEDLNGFMRLAKEANSEFIAVGYPPDIALTTMDMAVKCLKGEMVPHYVNVDAKTFDNTELDKYYLPDMSDDLFVIHFFPPDWLVKLGFAKQ